MGCPVRKIFSIKIAKRLQFRMAELKCENMGWRRCPAAQGLEGDFVSVVLQSRLRSVLQPMRKTILSSEVALVP